MYPLTAMTDDLPYGARFLDAWKRYSGTLSSFGYADIQRMKSADREAFIKILRERNSMLPYATIQLLRECDPEEAARALHLRAMQSAQAGHLTFWMIVAMT